MTTTRVVTELIVDARGAAAGTAEFERRMDAAQKAVDRLIQREQKLNETTQQTGQAMGGSTASVSKRAAQWDRLAASLDPVVAAEQKAAKAIREATQVADAGVRLLGRSQEEAAAMIAAVTAQQNGFVEAARKGASGSRTVAAATDTMAKSAGLARHEMVNLSRQMQDVVTMAAMGQAPMQIFTSQAAQIYDVFASSNATAGGFARQVAGIFSPARVAIGGVTAAVLAGAAAWIMYDSAQRETARTLAGLGRDSGLTVQGLNAIAEAQAKATGVSVGRARGTVSALAGTGRVGGGMIAPIQAIEKDFAATLGVNSAEANKMLAESFADPVRGAEMLAQRLGGVTLATRRQIEQLVAFGDQQRAQRVLLDAIAPRLGRAAELTSFWAREWARVSGASSEALNTLGRFIDRSVSGPGPTSFMEQAQRRFDQLKAGDQGQVIDRTNGRLLGMGLNPFGQTQEALQRETDGRRRVNAELEIQRAAMHAIQVGQDAITRSTERQAQVAADVARNQRLRDTATRTIEQINSPQTQQDRALQEAVTRLGTLRAAMDRPFETGSVVESANEFQRLQREVRGAEAAVRRLSQNNGAGVLDRRGGLLFDVTSPEGQARLLRESIAAQQRMNSEADARVAQGEARTVRQQQRAAQLEANLRRQTAGASAGDPALLAAEDARRNADIARGASFQLSEAAKERIRNTQASIDAVRVETAVLGGSVAAQEKARLEQQMLADAKREYQRLGLSVPQAEIDAYKRLAEAMGQARQEQALGRLRRDATFDRQTMFMPDGERQIAGQMRNVFGDDWKSQMQSAEAQMLRFNDTLRTTADLFSGFGSGMLQDLRNGANGWQALGNQVARVGDRLLAMAMDAALKQFLGMLMGQLGGLMGGGAGGATISPWSSYSSGGYTGAGAVNQPAGVVHRGEVVWSQRDVARAGGVAAVEAMRQGMRGYASGGAAGAPVAFSARPVNVVVNAPPGSDVKRTQDSQGNVQIDIVKTMEGALAQRVSTGRGALGKAVAARHAGLARGTRG